MEECCSLMALSWLHDLSSIRSLPVLDRFAKSNCWRIRRSFYPSLWHSALIRWELSESCPQSSRPDQAH